LAGRSAGTGRTAVVHARCGLPAGAGPRLRLVRRARVAARGGAAEPERLVDAPVRDLRPPGRRRLAPALCPAAVTDAVDPGFHRAPRRRWYRGSGARWLRYLRGVLRRAARR